MCCSGSEAQRLHSPCDNAAILAIARPAVLPLHNMKGIFFFFFLTLEKTWILQTQLTILDGLRWELHSQHLKFEVAMNSAMPVIQTFAWV